MPTFNLVDEPWIPVLIGEETREVGLREVFHRAGEISELVASSPLATPALYRLLLAIFHRVYGPANHRAWVGLWEAGKIDLGPLDTYLDECHPRFDLFDPEDPFYQTTNTRGASPAAVSTLAHEYGPTNDSHFSHVCAATEPAFTPAQAAQYLLAWQCFARPGLVTPVPGEPNTRSAEAGPLAFGAVCLVRGNNLVQTLLLNAVRYDGRDLPFPGQQNDAPVWERGPYGREVRLPRGYLDWLTWPSRSIWLQPSEDGTVERAVVVKGVQLPKDVSAHLYETMVAFKLPDEKRAKLGEGPKPLGFLPERALWRDSLALVQNSLQRDRPRTLQEDAAPERLDVLGEDTVFPLDVYGVYFIKGQGSVGLWRHERLPLPLAYLNEPDLQGRLDEAVQVTEAVAGALRFSTRLLAENLLAPDFGEGRRKPDMDAVRALTAELGSERRFWSQLEPHFWEFLEGQAAEYRLEHRGRRYGDAALSRWKRVVGDAADRSFNEVAQALGGSGRVLRAMVQARGPLEGALLGMRGKKQQEGAA